MKKLIVFSVFLFSMCVNYIPVSAEKTNKHNFQGTEQVFDQFLLSQFTDEMGQAMNDFYKKDSIRAQYNWWNKHNDVVEILQSEKGREFSHPFIIKFTVDTYEGNKKGQLGTDTIVFGVSPLQFNKELDEKNLAASKVELIDYIHRDPTDAKDN